MSYYIIGNKEMIVSIARYDCFYSTMDFRANRFFAH